MGLTVWVLPVVSLMTRTPFRKDSAWASLWLWREGLVALWHVGSEFPDQGSNPHPFIGRWILNHWTTREVPHTAF